MNIRYALFTNHKHATIANKGVTLLEIIITTLLFITVTGSVYRIYTVATRSATQTRQDSIENRQMQHFFDRFRHQIENALQLPNSIATLMEVSVPSECNEIGAPLSMGWGIISFPGHDVDLMTSNHTNLTPINPQDYVALATPESSDAVMMVFVEPETKMYQQKLDLSGDPFALTGASTMIHVTHDGDIDLAVGDYAVISDTLKSELIRITSVTAGSNDAIIEHDDTQSVWNIPFQSDLHFGDGQGTGNAFVYKVGVATYAVDTETNVLMVDDHRLDDEFDGSLFGAPGLARNWQPAVPGVTSLHILYETIYGETRTPMPGIPGVSYLECDGALHLEPSMCECENQLGNPGLKNIKLEITYDQ